MNDPESVVTGWKVYYSGLVRIGGPCVKCYSYYIGYLELLRDLGELFKATTATLLQRNAFQETYTPPFW